MQKLLVILFSTESLCQDTNSSPMYKNVKSKCLNNCFYYQLKLEAGISGKTGSQVGGIKNGFVLLGTASSSNILYCNILYM